MSDFDPKKVTMSLSIHLNGGKEYNKSVYEVSYDGHRIGDAVKGREGDRKNFFDFHVGDKVFDMFKEKDAAIDAVKDRFLELKESGEIK